MVRLHLLILLSKEILGQLFQHIKLAVSSHSYNLKALTA